MGNGDSHEVHYVYQVPPETQQLLNEQTKRIESLEKEAKEKGDPRLFEENSKKMMDTFVSQLSKLELTSIIKKKTGETHIGFVGPISAGKTSVINALFGLKLPVALGHCTQKCEVVHTENLNVIWDVCGTNDDFKFYKPESLSFIKDLDKVVIVFDNDIAMISNFLKVISTLNKNIVIIRTKLDQFQAGHARSITEEKELDKKKVKELINIDLEIFYVSSHNVSGNKFQMFDWSSFRSELCLNPPTNPQSKPNANPNANAIPKLGRVSAFGKVSSPN